MKPLKIKHIIFYNKKTPRKFFRWYDSTSFLLHFSHYNNFVAVAAFDNANETVDYFDKVMIEDLPINLDRLHTH